MYKHVILFLLINFIPINLSHAVSTNCPPKLLIEGVADMRCWNGSDIIPLTGDWLTEYRSTDEKLVYQGISSFPIGSKIADSAVPFLGHGVYRAKILLSKAQDDLALQLPQCYMARKVMLIGADGTQKVLFDSGKTAATERAIFPMRTPLIFIGAMDAQSELVVITNNTEFKHRDGEELLLLGSAEKMVRQSQLQKSQSIFISAILFFFALLNFSTWLVLRHNAGLFFLAALSLSLSVREITTAGVIYDIFPGLLTTFDIAIGWGTLFFGVVFGVMYFRAFYPSLIPRWLLAVNIGLAFIGISIYLTTPHYVLQEFGIYYRWAVLLLAIITIGCLFRGLRQPNQLLKPAIASGFVPILSLIVEIVHFQVTNTHFALSVAAIGMTIFVGAQTLLMGIRYASSVKKSVVLTAELQHLNTSLEEKVAQRTNELAQTNTQLLGLTRTDPLTGLGNRRALDDFIANEVARGLRSGKLFVVCMIDIDHFKLVNDQYGHDIGDKVLEILAQIITKSARPADFQGRLGGEEFCTILVETSYDQALHATERLQQAIVDHVFDFEDQTFSISASFGLALWQPEKSIEHLLKAADIALYRAKKSGRNRICSD